MTCRSLLPAVAVATAAVLAAARIRRVAVSGGSMAPSLEAGDRLLVVRGWPLREGAIVAVPDPRHSSRLLVKRVRRLDGDLVDVRGDNETASTDSRSFGLVPRSAVVGTVLYRYGPPNRVGWQLAGLRPAANPRGVSSRP
jgi:nickel-type superoxide dismutase maturation protease